MMKILKWISGLSLIFAALSIHTYKTKYTTLGSGEGWYSKIVSALVFIPEALSDLNDNEFSFSKSDAYCKVDKSFKSINKLSEDVFLLGGNWDEEEDRWNVDLKNLRTDSVLKSWQVDESLYIKEKSPRLYANAEVANPILLSDNSLIVGQVGSYNLYRINSNSEKVWSNHDYYIHHSMNLNHNQNIWVCTRKNRAQVYQADKSFSKPYLDDLLVLINSEDGSVEFEKSALEILKENNLHAFAFGMNGAIGDEQSKFDPIHLNDIEPVLKSGRIQKKGDVWLSFRNISTIMLYRPSTNKIIKVENGRFVHQHDVDIINDSVITVFNNNYVTGPKSNVVSNSRIDSLQASQILSIDLVNSSVKEPLKVILNNNNIVTPTEGLAEHLNNDVWFIEEQNNGRIYIMNSNEILYSAYYDLYNSEYSELPHWSRVYTSLSFLND